MIYNIQIEQHQYGRVIRGSSLNTTFKHPFNIILFNKNEFQFSNCQHALHNNSVGLHIILN